METNKVYLNVGCGGFYPPNLTNLNKDMLDISQPWFDYKDESIDGITSMHVLNELDWRGIVTAFREMYRTLKPEGVLRMGVPHLDSGMSLDWLLGWNNHQLFTEEQLRKVLTMVGFTTIVKCSYKFTLSEHSVIVDADNRADETLYLEAYKMKLALTT